MNQIYAAFLILATIAITNGQLFNDIVPIARGGTKGVFQKTINYDNVKFAQRPGAKNGYLPPEPPTYLPPLPGSSSTNGPTYLPPTTTRPPRVTVTIMPTMGTYPSVSYNPYTSTTYRTTQKRMPPPSTLPPLTTPRPTTTGYYYNKPDQPYLVEELRKLKF